MSKSIQLNKAVGNEISTGIKLPTVGRMVQFYPCKTTSHMRYDVYPAIVVNCVDSAPALTVFTEDGAIHMPTVMHKANSFNAGGDQLFNYWDWPEIK